MADDDAKQPAPENNAVEDSYYDPYDEYGPFTEEELTNIISTPNPTLMDDVSFSETAFPPAPPPSAMDISETSLSQELSLSFSNYDTNEFLDDELNINWDVFDDLNENINNMELGDIVNGNNTVVETTRLEVSNRVFGQNGANFETGGTSAMPVTPLNMNISEGILLCTCCNPLRGLIHGNGIELMRLDIHGGIGFVCHAILETRGFGRPNRHQTLDLKNLNMEGVKGFIENYCSEREREGFAILQDTNAGFYEAMHAWSIKNKSFLSDLPSRSKIPMCLLMPDKALNVPHVPLYVGLGEEPSVKMKIRTPLALQRERAGKLTVKDIGKYFNLPIDEAARRMEVCPTVVKKICRKGGLLRWPYRKIRSIEKKIASLRNMLSTATNPKIKARIQQEIEKFQREINEICSKALENFK